MDSTSRLNWPRIKGLHAVMLLFLPPTGGLLFQLATVTTWDQRCLALALLLLCVDQARMAGVDLQDIAAVRSLDSQIANDPRLDRFAWVTLSTIAIELIGFYLALPWLAWGIVLVLFSQLWFHGLASVQLQPERPDPLVSFGVWMRSPVLIANAVGIALTLLWQYGIWPLSMAILLLVMVLTYGVVKYFSTDQKNKDA